MPNRPGRTLPSVFGRRGPGPDHATLGPVPASFPSDVQAEYAGQILVSYRAVRITDRSHDLVPDPRRAVADAFLDGHHGRTPVGESVAGLLAGAFSVTAKTSRVGSISLSSLILISIDAVLSPAAT